MVIEDDGAGMSVQDLQDYWMVIGTTNKVKQRRHGKGRVLAGEKGLGRLGLDRLSRKTRIQSITLGADAALDMEVDWSLYEIEGAKLESIALEIFSIESLNVDPISDEMVQYPKGTRLILTELKDAWTGAGLEVLHRELTLLVSPFESESGFRIELETGYESIDGLISSSESLVQAAEWKVTSSIDADGNVRMRMESLRHNVVYEEGPTPWAERVKGFGENPLCGPLDFEFYYIPRKNVSLGDSSISVSEIKKFLDANQGLRIYRDGFRVKPYGSPNGEGDWLRLAYRRSQSPGGATQAEGVGSWRVAYHQVFGALFISREKNDQLLDQTNREGLMDGPALAHVRIFSEDTVSFFELNHQIFERSKVQEQTPISKAQEQVENSVQQAERAVAKLDEIADQFSSALKLPDDSGRATERPNVQLEGDRAKALLEEVQKELLETKVKLKESSDAFKAEAKRGSKEKDTLANLASLGILAAAFGHETLGWASSCSTNALWLERNLPKYFFFNNDEEGDEVRQKLSDTTTQAQRIETFAEFSIGNVKPEKRRRTKFCLKKVIQNVFRTFDESLRVQRNINLDVFSNLPESPCRIKGYPIDWESVLVNFITNAEWAIREKKEVYDRKIRVSLVKEDSSFVMKFEDNGIGISEEQLQRIGGATNCL